MNLTPPREDIDLTCPVCLEVFKDPCFVCKNHHTLCRACYRATAINPGSRCPLCREKLQKPVDNFLMCRLIEASNPQKNVVTRSGQDNQTQQNVATTVRTVVETCTVEIFSVRFNETCQTLKNLDLDDTKCYVSFQLPGFPFQETETPNSLPTPTPGRSRPEEFSLSYNFKKLYEYSFDSSYEKRKLLAALFLQSEHIEITFTVVCEPSDPDSDFYMDLGQAIVNLDGRIARGDDILMESFPLMLNHDHVGSIKLSMDLPSLLLEVYKELPDSKKLSVKFLKM